MARSAELDNAAIEAMFHDPDGPIAEIIERDTIDVENEAKRLLLIPGSGRVYDTTFYRDKEGRLRKGPHRVPHQASAPGEPPASDTGHLLASVGHRMGVDEDGVYGEVGSDQNKAEYLELGTRYMEPRPFLRPALDVLLDK